MSYLYVIPDTREGWVESVKLLIDSYFTGSAPVEFDYSNIRPAGAPIKGFGGIASGPEPLMELHKALCDGLDKNTGKDGKSSWLGINGITTNGGALNLKKNFIKC